MADGANYLDVLVHAKKRAMGSATHIGRSCGLRLRRSGLPPASLSPTEPQFSVTSSGHALPHHTEMSGRGRFRRRDPRDEQKHRPFALPSKGVSALRLCLPHSTNRALADMVEPKCMTSSSISVLDSPSFCCHLSLDNLTSIRVAVCV